jgi:dTDP-4-amino-4,6-dideoxygalactose transaminase
MAERVGAKHAVAVANGTVAIDLALLTMGIEPGDEVIVPAFTYVATAEVIGLLGLTPVMIDVDPKTLNIDVSKIESSITPQTTAIMPVHCYGHPCDVDAIEKIYANILQ